VRQLPQPVHLPTFCKKIYSDFPNSRNKKLVSLSERQMFKLSSRFFWIFRIEFINEKKNTTFETSLKVAKTGAFTLHGFAPLALIACV